MTPPGPPALPLDLHAMLLPPPRSAAFALPDFHVWCGSIASDGGDYWMFYSRWPAHLGHMAWATHSEIALAHATNLLGPYKHVKVVLPARGKAFWDGGMTHNPFALRHAGRYYLYYTGNRGPWDGVVPPGPIPVDDRWWAHRNRQRVGLAVADSPRGPWRRSDRPLIEPDRGNLITATPSVMVRPDGAIQLLHKTVLPGPAPFGGRVRHMLSTADHPHGPFHARPTEMLPGTKTNFPIDDHFMFHYRGRYYAIVKDHGENLTEHGISLLLLESEDGFAWRLAERPLVTPFQITWADGATESFERLEMPRLLFEGGEPRALQLSALSHEGRLSFNLRVPLRDRVV